MASSQGYRPCTNTDIEGNATLLMHLHIGDNHDARHRPRVSGSSDRPSVRPQHSPTSKSLQDYQLYLTMLEQAKQEELQFNNAKQSRRASITRTHTDIQPQAPSSPGAVKEWKPYRVLDIGVKPSNLFGQVEGQPMENHALTDYQKQLMLLEEQNQIRLQQARVAHRSQRSPANSRGAGNVLSPFTPSTESEMSTPSTEAEYREASSRPRRRTGPTGS